FAESQLLTNLDPNLPQVVANEGQLRQVFLGLSANALEAMEGRGALTVCSRPRSGGEVEIAFEDEGPGIPAAVLPRIFDPFFTTKPPGQGTGLGLAIAQGIVADHGGRIEVSARPTGGTVFRVVLPIGAPGEMRTGRRRSAGAWPETSGISASRWGADAGRKGTAAPASPRGGGRATAAAT